MKKKNGGYFKNLNEKEEIQINELSYFFYKKISFSFILLIANIIFIVISFNKNYNIINFYYRKRLHFLKRNKKNYNKLNIITFEDKLNWLAINDVNELKVNCSDKILLHEYSIKKLGKDICNKILKKYDNPEQINFKELPEKFMIKTNHGSGFNILVNNKTNININKIKKKLSEWMKIDYGKLGTEFHYKKKKSDCL